MSHLPRLLFVTLTLLLLSTSLQARSLYWEDMHVEARLDADGNLHIIERQHYVFNGDWNGGERSFDLGWGEGLQILRISRIDEPTQTRVDLLEGDLSAVDQYRIIDGTTLRWRSRLPADPAFTNQHLVYEIEYLYTNILRYRDGKYHLNHNFAFADRPGDFRHYHLHLQIDPIWQVSTQPFATTIEKTDLSPGEDVVVQAEMDYLGSAAPAGVDLPTPMSWRLTMFAALALFVLVYLGLWIRAEAGQGRFKRMLAVGEIDQAWLEKHVFNQLPEQVGSLWDLDVDAAEVAAMLARLTLEGKLQSRIERGGFWIFKRTILHLELLVARSELTANELSVIKGLFPEGNVTSTDIIREHYRRRGFDPAAGLRRRLRSHRLETRNNGKTSRRHYPAILLFLAALACAVIGLTNGSINDVIFVVPAIILTLLGWLFFSAKAYRLRFEVQRPRRALFWTVFRYLLLVAIVAVFIFTGLGQPSVWFVAMYLLILAGLFAYIMQASRSRNTIEEIALRKQLCAARRYFQYQLKQPEPQLQDAWFPYLIAFGLDRSMAKWFRAYGGQELSDSGSGFSSVSSTSGSSTHWHGGGGSFGGAGASGAWTTAATSMGAGFSAPSSSSSGGSSGGGGGGSSGGGGGGGW